jgi:voltage-gated potassium channel
VANVVAVILESLPEIGATHRAWFETFELFSVAVFATEYLLRL